MENPLTLVVSSFLILAGGAAIEQFFIDGFWLVKLNSLVQSRENEVGRWRVEMVHITTLFFSFLHWVTVTVSFFPRLQACITHTITFQAARITYTITFQAACITFQVCILIINPKIIEYYECTLNAYFFLSHK